MNDIQLPQQNQSRRSFIVNVLIILTSLAGFVVSIPVIGSLLSPLFKKPAQKWRPVGKIDDFTVGQTVLVKFSNSDQQPWDGVTSQTSAWLRREKEDEFIAFSVNCTHLGCPVRWVATSELFLCPCHGGVYYKDGSYAAGPPPHGLNRYPVRLNNNEVEILASPIPITTD